jgi:hypothetical protein
MAIRCTARDVARNHAASLSNEMMPAIYGYEPGWLGGTPMSDAVMERLPEGVVPHRIPSGRHMSPYDLSVMIVANLKQGNNLMNGALIRIDGGEQ